MKYKLILAIVLAITIGLLLRHFFPVDIPYCDNLCELRRMG